MEKITGWIKSIRQSKKIKFIAFTDGVRDSQLTLIEGQYTLEGEPKIGASFKAFGVKSITPRGFEEYVVSDISIIGKSDDTYPIQPKHHSDEFLRSIPALRGRAKGIQATWKIRHHLTQGIHRFLEDRGFYQYYTPIITEADCEGAGETFKVESDWLSESLTVSGQLHLEAGMMSMGQVYTFSPCFRAEKSATRKHLSEFWMVEVESAHYTLDDTISLIEDFVKSTLKYVLGKSAYELSQLEISSEHIDEVLKSDWKVITYDEVCELFGVKWGDDISSEVERLVVDRFGPTFITHYPADLKPFYMTKARIDQGESKARCFDLIFPEVGELVGGSEREWDYDMLLASMDGMDMEKMQWYLDTRKWGSIPHAGFGAGIDRLMMFIVKASKIHDVIPFPVSY